PDSLLQYLCSLPCRVVRPALLGVAGTGPGKQLPAKPLCAGTAVPCAPYCLRGAGIIDRLQRTVLLPAVPGIRGRDCLHCPPSPDPMDLLPDSGLLVPDAVPGEPVSAGLRKRTGTSRP